MKSYFTLVALSSVLPFNHADQMMPLTTVTTTRLRGKHVKHTRTIHPRKNHNPMVEEHREIGQHSHKNQNHGESHRHRVDSNLQHYDNHEHHFDSHEKVEYHHEHHHKHYYNNHHGENHAKINEEIEDVTEESEHKTPAHSQKRKNKKHKEKAPHTLPTGLVEHFNKTLFHHLHDAPFDIYASALDQKMEKGESFPVFSVPQWHNATGIFSGFSKNATPLVFENAQFLLHWHDIVTANSGASEELENFMQNNNFYSSLTIGKAFRNDLHINFLGLVVSYYQYGAEKNILVPFARVEDFFDDTSEQHMLNPNLKALELDALHDMLNEKRNSSSQFYHPAWEISEERKQLIEDLEIIHFQKLFQLLIRRSFLFSFGYADCLMSEPNELRSCLDDTFYSVVKMETSVRGALDNQIAERMTEISESFRSKVSEACMTERGDRSVPCADANGLSSFVSSSAPVVP